MASLKLEVGGVYRSRDGVRVEIVHNDGDSLWPFIGSNSLTYTEKGAYWSNGRESSSDLVEEVSSPPVSPVRTVTRKEILPGIYGAVSIDRSFDNALDIMVSLDVASPASIRAAIATLSEIADAMDAQK